MENSVSKKSSGMIGAVLLGAVIGIALGVLFAPAKGGVIRKKLAKRFAKAENSGQDGTENFEDPEDQNPV